MPYAVNHLDAIAPRFHDRVEIGNRRVSAIDFSSADAASQEAVGGCTRAGST